jgi:hypothetical protein
MTDWIRFTLIAFIVCVLAVEDVLRELMMSFRATLDFLRYRVRYIVQDKLRSLWRRDA